MVEIHPSWNEEVMEEFGKLYWKELLDFLDFQYLNGSCLPDKKDIFRAFDMTPFDTIKVVIVGQDPYHTP